MFNYLLYCKTIVVCPDFCSELKEFQDELEEIKNKFDAQTELSTMTHNYYKQDIFKLKEKVDTSSFMKIFSLRSLSSSFWFEV